MVIVIAVMLASFGVALVLRGLHMILWAIWNLVTIIIDERKDR